MVQIEVQPPGVDFGRFALAVFLSASHAHRTDAIDLEQASFPLWLYKGRNLIERHSFKRISRIGQNRLLITIAVEAPDALARRPGVRDEMPLDL